MIKNKKQYKYITKNNVLKSARKILYLWQEIINNSNGNAWYKVEQCQAYRNCLEIMKRNHLIKDYFVNTKKNDFYPNGVIPL